MVMAAARIGRSNTAVRVLGADAVQARVNRARTANRSLLIALRALLRQVARRVPVVTGRLFRSLTTRLENLGPGVFAFTIRFRAPYALWPEIRSRLNRRYFERGLTAGIAEANRFGKSVGIRFRRGPIRRVGRAASIECRIIITVR